MEIIRKMPVKSLITFPKSQVRHVSHKKTFSCRGFAWTGEEAIRDVSISFDFGQSWQKTKLSAPKNRFGWQRWEHQFVFPKPGYYELWARATDSSNFMQPMVVPGWNPKGYLNNAMPRIAVEVLS